MVINRAGTCDRRHFTKTTDTEASIEEIEETPRERYAYSTVIQYRF